jgi:phage terminase large subunit-like protein
MEWLGSLSEPELAALEYDWNFFARPNQRNPFNNKWKILLLLAGRGFGKTRTASELVRQWIESGEKKHVAIVGTTAADVRDTMVESVFKQGSGLLQICPPWNRPHYSPTKKTLTWTNPNYPSYGAVCSLYSAEDPDQLRGPSHDGAWVDEWAKMKYGEMMWHMLKFTMRRGDNPQTIISTTPKPVSFLIDMLKMAQECKAEGSNEIVVIKGSTYENRANLASEFLKDINAEYEGTTLGRQEIYADLILDTDGALWSLGLIEKFRIKNGDIPSLRQVVIAIDPQAGYKYDKSVPVKSLSKIGRSTMTGIVAVGSSLPVRGFPQHGYVLEDSSINGKPEEWASQAIRMYRHYAARVPTRLIAESNQGGEMIRSIIQNQDRTVPVHLVRATVKKHERAIPVVAKYEKGLIHHVGIFADLEGEMISYEPGDEDQKMSPNRMDALVWAIRYLLIDGVRAGAGIALTRRV